MSGCPLRCQYCQNPDTWKMRGRHGPCVPGGHGGQGRTVRGPVRRPPASGITFSGGESMMQPACRAAVFRAAKEMGVHTCL
ncbi:MAG: 4Fe-4S cluster-binding domain-containing protein [Bifidobacterium pullorum]